MCIPLQRGPGSKAPRDGAFWEGVSIYSVRLTKSQVRWGLGRGHWLLMGYPLQEWLQYIDGGRRKVTEDKLRGVEGEVRAEQLFQEVWLRRERGCGRGFPGGAVVGLSAATASAWVWSLARKRRSRELCSVAKRKETKKHDFPLMILLYLKKGVEFLSGSVVRTVELSLPRPGFDLVGQINKYREVIF